MKCNDDLELNYYETPFRNYDAQIGRFTGVDLLAEENYSSTPYNYGLNNPVLYNDPSGLQQTYSWGQMLNGLSNGSLAQGHYQNNGGGYSFDYTPWNDDQAFGWAVGWMDTYDHWGTQPGWASSFGHALSNYTAARGSMASGSTMGYNYITHTFSAALYTGGYLGEAVTHNGTIAETYYYAGYGDVLDFNAMAAGYALHNPTLAERFQMPLDAIGMSEIPLVSQAAELISAGISFGSGDMTGGFIGLGAMIPLGGKAFEAMKIARYASKGGKGGLNLFKFGSKEAKSITGWKSGDRFLKMFDQGSPKLNWKQNSGFLRQEMRAGNPIFDSYRLPNGNLISIGGFLNAERNLLQSRGWTYNPG